MAHSCGHYSIAQHFAGKPESTRRLFDDLTALVGRVGPTTCYAEKTRIVFQTRARFLAVVPRRQWLACHLWLKRRVPDARFHRIDSLADRDFVHHFRIATTRDLDAGLLQHIHESYRVGSQEELRA
jgi:hypothetical protein